MSIYSKMSNNNNLTDTLSSMIISPSHPHFSGYILHFVVVVISLIIDKA